MNRAQHRDTPGPRPVAVIDVGSTSVRMVIAEISPRGEVRELEMLDQEVSLGSDTFTKGIVEDGSIKECVAALQSYRRLLNEYHITDPHDIRAVATSAIREARNREIVLGRIHDATGFRIGTIEDAEVNRYTYLGLQPFIDAVDSLKNGDVIVVEVAGGSTEILVVQKGRVTLSHSFRMGSFRMRETFEKYGASDVRLLAAMENEIRKTVLDIRQKVTLGRRARMIVLGGDARFAAGHLRGHWDLEQLITVPVSSLNNFSSRLLEMSSDQIVRRYHLSYPEADTVGPALLAYVRIANAVRVGTLYVSPSTMREGILREMAAGETWNETYRNQVVQSALEIGRRYAFDRDLAEHIAGICVTLFRGLREYHHLNSRYELILHVAALLHKVGYFVNSRSHHKHSMYLIRNSNIFGLSTKNLMLTALTARYYRKAMPTSTHEGYRMLSLENRMVVAKLAAILRIADALENSATQRISSIEIDISGQTMYILVYGIDDLTVQDLALQDRKELFQRVYGLDVELKTASMHPGETQHGGTQGQG